MFDDVVGMFPKFNNDPNELERQQQVIKMMELRESNPVKFAEKYLGIKLRWYQKILLRSI